MIHETKKKISLMQKCTHSGLKAYPKPVTQRYSGKTLL